MWISVWMWSGWRS